MTLYTGKDTIEEYIIEPLPDGYHILRTSANGEQVDINVEVVNINTDFNITDAQSGFVPILTSATSSPGHVARTSSEYPTGLAWTAFSGDKEQPNGAAWVTNATKTGWLEIEFPEPKKINSYSLAGQIGYPTRSPKNWRLLGSNDGVNYDVIDTMSNVTVWPASIYNHYAVSPTMAYKIYRIDVSANNGDTTYLSIGSWQLYDSLGDLVEDESMLILKFNKNLTIESNATLIPRRRRRGMFVYVKGKLTNNGTISMTARGAKAAGQNVHMFYNTDNILCTIPAVGGAIRTQANQGGETAGHTYAAAGFAGVGRQTGGGAPGAARATAGGAGAAGTSYSGGSGGGGANWGNGTAIAGAGVANGGAGGVAATTSLYSHSAGGGAGNPGGNGHAGNRGDGYPGYKGTGGLLIILANEIINNGSFTSQGSAGGNGYRAGGGGSGGGHIEIASVFPVTKIGTINVSGGAAGVGTRGDESGHGGIGGTGTYTVAQVSSYKYKYLFQFGTDIKYFDGSLMTTIGQVPVTEAMFNEFGAFNIRNVPISALHSNTVLLAQAIENVTIPPVGAKVIGAPHSQVIAMTTDIGIHEIENIKSFNITYQSMGLSEIRVLVSFDKGMTWVATQGPGKAWSTVNIKDKAAVVANGITLATFISLTATDWQAARGISGDMRLAYYLDNVNAFEFPSIDQVGFLVDMKGSWRKTINGTDYKMQFIGPRRAKIILQANGTYKINY